MIRKAGVIVFTLVAVFVLALNANAWSISSKIAAGSGYTVVIKSDGTLWAWGLNNYGQLGNGTTVNASSPVQVGTETGWASVAAGDGHTVAIKSDGTLWAWGWNSDGQVGDGTTVDVLIPVQIGVGSQWTSVAAGWRHTVAIKSDGTLWAWGYNWGGQLGDGTRVNSSSPLQIGTGSQWTAVAAGHYITLAIKSDGTLWVTSEGMTTNPSLVQVGSENRWAAISEATDLTIAIKSDGTLWTWGSNSNGQLGNGTWWPSEEPVQIGTDRLWKSIAAGYAYGAAIAQDGSLWAWGYNALGQIGDGTFVDQLTPVRIGDIEHQWVLVSAGYDHSVGLTSDGTLWTWGANTSGQLGIGEAAEKTSPARIAPDTQWSALAAGYSHTVAIKSDGTLWAWGANDRHQLGDGTSVPKQLPVQIGTENVWTAITANENHTIALKSDGTLWAWGANGGGQLGDVRMWDTTPVQIATSGVWSVVSTGESHTAAIASDGTLWAWGYNGDGQLGNGAVGNRSITSPVQVEPGTLWAAVAAGNVDTAGIRSDGTLWAWGRNFCAHTPDGLAVRDSIPVQIGTENHWTAVRASVEPGYSNMYALKSDGTLWSLSCSGDQRVLVQNATERQWAAVTAGYEYTIALASDGTLWSWGWNNHGQLGDGTFVNKETPVQIGTERQWSTVAAGHMHNLAIASDGSLWGWGSNWIGELGDGMAFREVPIALMSIGPFAPVIITPNAGINGSISPIAPVTIPFASSASFTITPDPGYFVYRIAGCGGTRSGNTYTTGLVTSDCAATVEFTSVPVPPVVTIISPSEGFARTNMPLLDYTVTTGNAIVKVDGIVVSKVAGEQLNWLAEGTHTVRVESTDAVGNSGFSQVTFTVDTIAPVVTITSPAQGRTNYNVLMLTYSVDEGAAIVVLDGVVISKVSGDTLGPLADGIHTLLVASTDVANNTGFASVSFTVDTTRPPITIRVTSPTTLKTQTISGNRAAGIVVTVAVNTAATGGPVSYPTATTWKCTISNLVYGVNVITATARDSVGNTATVTASITEKTH